MFILEYIYTPKPVYSINVAFKGDHLLWKANIDLVEKELTGNIFFKHICCKLKIEVFQWL